MKKGAQQEIAGFVIIVVLVVVAMFIFMVLSLGNKDQKTSSVEVDALLSALLEQTTDCVVREPLPLNVGELIDKSFGGIQNCRNSGESTQDHLNRTITDTMKNVLKMENRFEAWQIDIYPIGEDSSFVGRFYQGQCGDKERIGSDRDLGEFRVWLGICLN